VTEFLFLAPSFAKMRNQFWAVTSVFFGCEISPNAKSVLGAGTSVCFWCKISPKCEISFWGLRPAFFFFWGEKFRQNLKSALGL